MKSKLRQDAPMSVYPVRLTAAHAIAARRIGAGNLSDGVRMAVEACKENPSMLGSALTFPSKVRS